MGVFSNQELFEVDAMTNPRKKRKKYLINQTEWRAPYDDEVPWLTKNNVRQYKSAIQRYSLKSQFSNKLVLYTF
jgi:hypothetical protein